MLIPNSSFQSNYENNHNHHHHNRNIYNDSKLSFDKSSNLSTLTSKPILSSSPPSSRPNLTTTPSQQSSASSISSSLVGSSSSIILTVTTTMSTITTTTTTTNQPNSDVEIVNQSQNARLFSFVNSQSTNFFGINDRDVPILIGAAVGALGLFIIILAAIMAWYCCQYGIRRQRSAYCLDEENEKWASCSNLGSGIFADNDSVIFTGMENLNNQNTRGHNIKRSLSAQLHMVNPNLTMDSTKSSIIEKRYPHSIETIKTHLKPSNSIISDDINSIIVCDENIITKNNNNSTRSSNRSIASKNPNYLDEGEIDEDEEGDDYKDNKFRYNSKSQLYSAVINTVNHANCSYSSDIITDCANLKTRSLPWKKISTETEEPIKFTNNQTKLNFTKKRANRMRNDSAAAIALNRSGATPTHLPYLTKETDCLVDNDSLIDNEAVVVYDERTVL